MNFQVSLSIIFTARNGISNALYSLRNSDETNQNRKVRSETITFPTTKIQKSHECIDCTVCIQTLIGHLLVIGRHCFHYWNRSVESSDSSAKIPWGLSVFWMDSEWVLSFLIAAEILENSCALGMESEKTDSDSLLIDLTLNNIGA